MILKNRLTIVVLLVSVISFAQDQKLKKITIVEKNNPILNYNYERLKLPDSINTAEFDELKKYVLSKTTIKSTSEPELYYELMEWVSNQWEHNGWNAAPDSLNALGILKSAHNDGQKYRCVEYGIVLNDILNSFGYTARTVGLKSPEVDYGGAGMGHVGTEVWSNNLDKWIFLDPQFGIYARKENLPLNIYEIYQSKKEGSFDAIEFIEIATNRANETYGGEFLSNYLGYIDIKQKNRNLNYSLALKMEGERDFLTFQAFPSINMMFTTNVEDMYYKLNQTTVLFEYDKEEVIRSHKEYEKLKIETMEDFSKNMKIFAAKPKFVLTFDNNMPWFKRYEVQLNNTSVNEKEGTYPIQLKEGLNTLRVVAVNQNDIAGVPTVIKLIYN